MSLELIHETAFGVLIHGDALERMRGIPADTVDLVMTSPPYADARKKQYGGVPPGKYSEWFLPISAEIMRILKPSGSFVLNIKEKVVNGERSDYVDELVREMRRGQGWKLPDKYIWHKSNPVPVGHNNRLKDTWENLFQFTKTLKYKFNSDGVLYPVKESTKSRMDSHISAGSPEKKKNAFGIFSNNIAGAWGIDMSRAPNIIHCASEVNERIHPAAFPLEIPEFFIKPMTEPGDMVLDPFAGSCTSCVTAKLNQRRYIGIDAKKGYLIAGVKRLDDCGRLFDAAADPGPEGGEQRRLF